MKSAELISAVWRKSSRSNSDLNCVEVAFLDDSRVATRDTKHKGKGPALVFTPQHWVVFEQALQGGDVRP